MQRYLKKDLIRAEPIMNKQLIEESKFIPAGYLYKKITKTPEGLNVSDAVEDIYSVSGCISDFFMDYVYYWQHNAYCIFNKPSIIQEIAKNEGIDLSSCWLFYYEVYELSFDDSNNIWIPLVLDNNGYLQDPDVVIPAHKTLKGFDVVSFSMGYLPPECSPLSCNALAKTIKVNNHCLFDTFDEAKVALDNGLFKNAEAGPYRILAVYQID